jgi:hypothetical protein
MAHLLAFVLAVVFLSTSTAVANPGLCKNIFQRDVPAARIRVYEASDNTSQYIRDNAPDFWKWTKTNARRYFGDLLNYQGVVIGDAHPGNFSFLPLGGRMKMFILDIEDSGHAPFIADLTHQIMSTNVIFKEGKEDLTRSTERQLEAYFTGLRGGRFQRHERIEEIFETSKTEYNAEVATYVDSKTTGDSFKFKSGKIESLEDHITNANTRNQIKSALRQTITSNIQGAKVLDFAFRPVERGGSVESDRYWVLIELRGNRHILEFKEITDSAVAQYGPQLAHQERLNLAMETFWQKEDRFYQVFNLNNKTFIMRPKKVDLFEVPYDQEGKTERKFLRHLAAYQAYLMGKYHGSQMSNRRYSQKLESSMEEVVEGINKMSDDYVERLEERVETRQENEDYD